MIAIFIMATVIIALLCYGFFASDRCDWCDKVVDKVHLAHGFGFCEDCYRRFK